MCDELRTLLTPTPHTTLSSKNKNKIYNMLQIIVKLDVATAHTLTHTDTQVHRHMAHFELIVVAVEQRLRLV